MQNVQFSNTAVSMNTHNVQQNVLENSVKPAVCVGSDFAADYNLAAHPLPSELTTINIVDRNQTPLVKFLKLSIMKMFIQTLM